MNDIDLTLNGWFLNKKVDVIVNRNFTTLINSRINLKRLKPTKQYPSIVDAILDDTNLNNIWAGIQSCLNSAWLSSRRYILDGEEKLCFMTGSKTCLSKFSFADEYGVACECCGRRLSIIDKYGLVDYIDTYIHYGLCIHCNRKFITDGRRFESQRVLKKYATVDKENYSDGEYMEIFTNNEINKNILKRYVW